VVNWVLYKEVLPISKEHLDAFKDVWYPILLNGNFRNCQPLCGRRVVRNFENLEESYVDHLNCVNHKHEVHQP